MKTYINNEEIKGVAIAGQEVLGVAKAGEIVYKKEIYRRVKCLVKRAFSIGVIDTGIKPNERTRVKAVLSLLETGNRSPFGGRTSINNSTFALLILNNGFVFDYGKKRVNLNIRADNDAIYEVDLNRNTWKINDTSGVVGSESFTSANKLALFGLNPGVSFVGKIYSAQIWQDDILVRDYVPMVRDGVAGMWDLVEGKFYTSANGHPFEYE